jgi:hypothetical protein
MELIDSKKGIVSKDDFRKYLNDLSNVVRNEKSNIENTMTSTPFITNSQSIESNDSIDNDQDFNPTDVNSTPEDITAIGSQMSSKFGSLEKRFEDRFKRLKNMVNKAMNDRNQRRVNNNFRDQRPQRKCWNCHKFGHIARNCRLNSDQNSRHQTKSTYDRTNRNVRNMSNTQTSHQQFNYQKSFLGEPKPYLFPHFGTPEPPYPMNTHFGAPIPQFPPKGQIIYF